MAVALLVLVAAWPGAASSSRGAAAPTGRILYLYDASGSSGPLLSAVAEADLESGRCRRLLTTPLFDTVLISPDGRSVVVAVEEAKSVELRVFSLETRRSRVVRRGPASLRAGAWSPDGERLAYLERGSLRVVGIDGRGDRLLARSASGNVSWSRDGTRLAFASTTGSFAARTVRTTLDVVTVSATQVARRTVFVDPAPYDSRPDASWSPDGSTIAFGVLRPARILAVAPTGGQVRTLTGGSIPRWSPDGSRISFRGSGPAGIEELWTMAADGTNKRRLTTSKPPPRGLGKYGSYPGPWSPDGEWIAYFRKWALATMSVDGGSARPRCPLPVGTGFGGAVWLD